MSSWKLNSTYNSVFRSLVHLLHSSTFFFFMSPVLECEVWKKVLKLSSNSFVASKSSSADNVLHFSARSCLLTNFCVMGGTVGVSLLLVFYCYLYFVQVVHEDRVGLDVGGCVKVDERVKFVNLLLCELYGCDKRYQFRKIIYNLFQFLFRHINI